MMACWAISEELAANLTSCLFPPYDLVLATHATVHNTLPPDLPGILQTTLSQVARDIAVEAQYIGLDIGSAQHLLALVLPLIDVYTWKDLDIRLSVEEERRTGSDLGGDDFPPWFPGEVAVRLAENSCRFWASFRRCIGEVWSSGLEEYYASRVSCGLESTVNTWQRELPELVRKLALKIEDTLGVSGKPTQGIPQLSIVPSYFVYPSSYLICSQAKADMILSGSPRDAASLAGAIVHELLHLYVGVCTDRRPGTSHSNTKELEERLVWAVHQRILMKCTGATGSSGRNLSINHHHICHERRRG